ncbi:ribonuclease H-like domain-containing protein [Infundibulicybe gibba]|nr:ribonuclease H-like domain-containing protein [Infundibulicybe gibba]
MSAPRPRPPTPKPIYSWRSFSPTTELIYIRDAHHANTELTDLGDGPLGFDLEWKPIWTKNTRENPVSLVQLASQSKIFLIQISAMSEFPAKLQQVLERADIVKAGVGIQGDALKLYHDHGVSTCNCVDLALLARSADNARWKGKYTQPIGLARLVDTYIDLQLTKGKITRSNWEAMLSPAQQQYAANDAHSGLMLHAILSGLAESMKVPPKPVYYSFHAICGNLYDSSGVQWTPSNPDYDPGPPPPPKVPKEPKDGELESQNKDKKTNNTREPRQGPSVSDGSRGPLPTNGSGSGSTGFQPPVLNHTRHAFQPSLPITGSLLLV